MTVGKFNFQEGMKRIYENLELLFARIVVELKEVNAGGHLLIEWQTKLRFGDIDQSCLLGVDRLGMGIFWFNRYSNMLDESAALTVREFDENLITPPGHVRLQQPEVLGEEEYDPDISRTREYVWKPRRRKGELITSKDLAANLVLQFLDLVERDRSGKIRRKGWH